MRVEITRDMVDKSIKEGEKAGYIAAPFDNPHSTLRFVPSMYPGFALKRLTLALIERYI